MADKFERLTITFEDSSLTPEENAALLDRMIDRLGYPTTAGNESVTWEQPEVREPVANVKQANRH